MQFAGKMSLARFTCVTCSLPVITGKFTCFEAASTSRRIHAIAVNKARKLHVNSPAWCRLTYLQFAGEFTRVVMADCLQLQVILRGIAGFFACDCAGIVSCVCSYFCLRLAGIFTCDSSVFACRSRQFCMLVAGKFAWVPHVKLPVKYLWYSGKFTCARRQCACVPREVLAVSKQVNLPVITGKPHVTQVKRARDLFTCELHAKLPAFAGNFARASFTVWHRRFPFSKSFRFYIFLMPSRPSSWELSFRPVRFVLSMNLLIFLLVFQHLKQAYDGVW